MKKMNTHFTLFTHTNYDDFNKKIDEKRWATGPEGISILKEKINLRAI